MMRDLEDICPDERAKAAGDHSLRGNIRVASEQRRDSAVFQQKDDGRIVAGRDREFAFSGMESVQTDATVDGNGFAAVDRCCGNPPCIDDTIDRTRRGLRRP